MGESNANDEITRHWVAGQEFPDFTSHGYQVEQELGHNRAGGRVTYLATDSSTQQQVVIKQFQFARLGTNWSDYDTYQREIHLLKDLHHPGIPAYLSAFQTPDGFCMVQEYKQAAPLTQVRSFSPDEIRQIAIAALEVLIYLQSRIPPVIHRDLKPANILVDGTGAVYLVDFGFAHVGEGEVGVSSVVKGTLGFMPPEQIFNRQLTEASDLYGLGMTLICLLTGTATDRIGNLVDISYRVSFKHLVPRLSPAWVNWLEKMVEPRLKDRFPNAVSALAALPVAPLRPPEARFSQSTIELRVNRLGDPLTGHLTLTNSIPETLLEGRWELVTHPHDPPPELAWIRVEPRVFQGNQIDCEIAIATSQLLPGKTYRRQLALQTNAQAKTYLLSLIIHTPTPSGASPWLPYGFLLGLGIVLTGLSWLLSWSGLTLGTIDGSVASTSLGILLATALGLELAAWVLRSAHWHIGPTTSTLAAILLGGVVVVRVLTEPLARASTVLLLGAAVGGVGGLMAGLALGIVAENLLLQGMPRSGAIATPLLTATLSVNLGLGLIWGFSQPLTLTLLLTSGCSLLFLLLRLHLKEMQINLYQRRGLQQRIKP